MVVVWELFVGEVGVVVIGVVGAVVVVLFGSASGA